MGPTEKREAVGSSRINSSDAYVGKVGAGSQTRTGMGGDGRLAWGRRVGDEEGQKGPEIPESC